MGKFCILTGADKTAEGYESPFKKMCLNCISCKADDPETTEGVNPLWCYNENVIEVGKKKILESLASQDFEVSAVDVKRMALKDPCKKCKQYQVNKEAVLKEIEEIFG